MRDVAPLSLVHITVRAGKLDFELACDAGRFHVDAVVAARVLRLLPNLARHVCVNEKGSRFADEIEGTESAHLFEHVAIELLGQAFPAQAACGAFRGYTTRADAACGECAPGTVAMRTTISCADDLSAMCAAREALRVVNWAFEAAEPAPARAFKTSGRMRDKAREAAGPAPEGAPDVEAMVRAVRAAAGADAS